MLRKTETNGCSPAEAESARNVASKILAKHGLTIDSVSKPCHNDSKPRPNISDIDTSIRFTILMEDLIKQHQKNLQSKLDLQNKIKESVEYKYHFKPSPDFFKPNPDFEAKQKELFKLSYMDYIKLAVPILLILAAVFLLIGSFFFT